MFVENWAVSSDEVAMEARAACQSLGAFYVAPTLVARRFLARPSLQIKEHKNPLSGWLQPC
jgi:hypothetical protein